MIKYSDKLRRFVMFLGFIVIISFKYLYRHIYNIMIIHVISEFLTFQTHYAVL